MYVLLGQSQVIQKIGPIGLCFIRPKPSDPKNRSNRPAPVRAWQYVFIIPRMKSSHCPYWKLPPLLVSTAGRGEASVHSLEIGATLVWLFYNNIMITLATDLVKQFYTYWKIQNNKAFLIISLKKLFDNFLHEIISKGCIFFWTLADGSEPMSHTHRHRPNSSYIDFWIL